MCRHVYVSTVYVFVLCMCVIVIVIVSVCVCVCVCVREGGREGGKEERMFPWVGSNSHLQHSRMLHTYMYIAIKSPRQLSAGVGSVRVSGHDKQMKVSAMSSILANT